MRKRSAGRSMPAMRWERDSTVSPGCTVMTLMRKRTRGLDFFQRQAAKRVHGFARIALAFGVALLGGEDEAVDVAAEAQRVDLELPLVAVRGRRGHRETVDGEVFGRSLVDAFHPAGVEIVGERLFGRHAHHVEAHRLGAALAHADHGLRGVVEREGLGRGKGEAELGMQEAPPAHETFAGVLAIDDVVDRGEIGLAVTFAALRRGELPRAGLRILHALGRRRVRGQEVLRARIERGLAGLQRRVALHRREESRGAIGIETGARRNPDANAVGLEFLRAREARHRQFGLGQRQRREIRIVAHVGDDAGHHRGLPRLVFPDRGVLGQHMRHLVAQHRGQFRGVAGERDQAARYIKLPGRQGERVHRPGIEDRDPVGLVGAIGRRDQPVDRLADQRCQLRIVIGAAIGGEDALMLALARRGLRRRCGLAWVPPERAPRSPTFRYCRRPQP